MKSARQAKILEIIAQQDIETQHQLMEALRAHGVKSTQATVSRDIKELRLVKELSGSGRYRYVAVGRDELVDYESRLRKIFRESVTSYAVAQNIIVIKTLPGLANGGLLRPGRHEYPRSGGHPGRGRHGLFGHARQRPPRSASATRSRRCSETVPTRRDGESELC
jgi:arginine repressor